MLIWILVTSVGGHWGRFCLWAVVSKLLGTLVCYGDIRLSPCFHFLLCIYSGLELLSGREFCLTFREVPHFSKVLHPLHPTAVYGDSNFFTSSPALFIFLFVCTAAGRVGGKWYLIVFCFVVPKTNDVEHLFMCLLATYMFSWRNVC